jgi:hypothetical protein
MVDLFERTWALGLNRLVVIVCVLFWGSSRLVAQEVKHEVLQSATVVAKSTDRAREVMRRAIDQRRTHLEAVQSFQCTTYAKSSYQSAGQVRLREQLAVTRSLGPSKLSDEILLYDDHKAGNRGGQNVEVRASLSFERQDNIAPTVAAGQEGAHFYDGWKDLDLNIYRSSLELPRLLAVPVPSPLADDAFVHYRFTLLGIDSVRGHAEYRIGVGPSLVGQRGFVGELTVEDSAYSVVRLQWRLPEGLRLGSMGQVVIRQSHVWAAPGASVPLERQVRYRYGGDAADTGTLLLYHSGWRINPPLRMADVGLAVVRFAPGAESAGQDAWAAVRRSPLTVEERRFASKQDSLLVYRSSDAYIDSVDAEYNRFRWWEPLVSGVGYRSRVKGYSWNIDPLVAQMRFFGVGGYRHNLGGYYERTLPNQRRWELRGDVDYGVVNGDTKGQLAWSYTYNPAKFGSVRLAVGDQYVQINSYEPILGTFARGNYARKISFSGSHRLEVVNGLYVRSSFDFARRQSIDNLRLEEWANQLFGELNDPEPFRPYAVSLLGLEVLYRPGQRYILRGNRKIALGSPYPDLTLRLQQGIPGLLGGMVGFTSARFEVSDNLEHPRWGYTRWSAGAGGFLAKELDSIRFIEHKFFRGSDQVLFSNPSNSMQALDSTYNTARPYLDFYGIHHFAHSPLDYIPLIKSLRITPVVGGSGMFIGEANWLHVEAYAGLEIPFRLWDQRFRYGVYWVRRIGEPTPEIFRFKVGFDVYDAFMGRWNY